MEKTTTPQPADSNIAIVETPQTYGPGNLWSQGDGISHSVILILLVMSILSWTQIAIKGYRAFRRSRIFSAIEMFWGESTLDKGIKKLTSEIGDSVFSELAKQAANSAKHFDEHGNDSIGNNLERSEFVTRALRQSILRSTARLESGQTMLASIGSIAPFVGLFGTVWGIYNALISISTSGAATLNKVSGPVGEALIMTAAGLFVAIPAVIAYNAFTRFNRLDLMELDGFAHDLHSYLNTGARVKGKPALHVVEKAGV